MAAAFSAETLLQSIADAVVAYDISFQIVFWSQSAARLFGWTAAEAIGQSILKLLSLRVPCEVKLDALQQLRNAGSWNLQMDLRTKNRELITVNVSLDSVLAADGQLTGYVSTFKRLPPEQQALFNYQKSTEIFHNSSDIIVIVDIDWVVRSWNSAAARSLKRSASEVVHKPLLQVLAGAMPRLPLLRLRRALQRCGRAHRELNLAGADGQRLVLDTEISEIRSNGNTLLGYLAIARDLTEIKRIANDYKTSEMRLRALMSVIPDSFFLVNRSGKIVDYMIGEHLAGEASSASDCSSCKCLIGYDIGTVFRDSHRQIAAVINKCLSEARISYFDYEEKSGDITRQSVLRVIAAGQDEVLIIVQDVTEQKQTQSQLRESEERFRTLVEQKPVGICVMQGGRFSYVNPKVCELLGYSRAELMEMTTRDIPILAEDFPIAQQRRKERLAGQYVPPYILRLKRKDGSLVYLETHVSTIQNQGRPAGLLTVIDVSGRLLAEHALRESEERYRTLIHTLEQGVLMLGADGRVVTCNAAAARLLEMSEEEILAAPADWERWPLLTEELMPLGSGQAPGLVTLRTGLAQLGTVLSLRLASGQLRLLSFSTRPLFRPGQPEPYAVVVSILDVTETKRTQEELFVRAFYDPLTGLPNRALFLDRVGRVLSSARRADQLAAVCFLDLDGFKDVNDVHGHAIGDELLKQVSSRLLRCVRDGDMVARLGGDEFTMLLCSLQDAADAIRIAQRILQALRRPFLCAGRSVLVSASVGISIAPRDGTGTDILLRKADVAMYQAKSQGKNCLYVFEPDPDASSDRLGQA